MKYLLTTMILLLASLAAADWSDNFDSYAVGSGISGQGGWICWNGNSAAEAYISTTQARSGANSLDITPTSDVVQQVGVTSGTAVISAWNYIPTGSTGKQYFILLTTYGGASGNDWALNMKFDMGTGVVSTVEGTATTGMIYDQWTEVKVEIDLAGDSQKIYYNGALLDTVQWSPTSQIYQFGAVDVFSDGGTSIYWDDFNLVGVQALSHTTWASIKTSI
jgi:hypothetical protein